MRRLTALLLCVALPAAANPRKAVTPAERLYLDGAEHFQAGRLPEALEYFAAAYRTSKKPELLINIAQCHRALGRREQAIAIFEKFISLAPEHPLRSNAEETLRDLRSAPESDAPRKTTVVLDPMLDDSAEQDELTAPAPAPADRRLLFAGIGGAVLVVGGIVLGAILLSRPQPQPQQPTPGGNELGTLHLPSR
jgi:tetratricopeptide (TPR) repeat protein